MEKKTYKGLAVDVISFGADTIETGHVVAVSGCYLGSVQYYTEAMDGTPAPMGMCWSPDDHTYSLDWAEYRGDYIP